MPPFVVRRLPIGTLYGPRLSRRHHLLYNPGPIAVVRIFCRLSVGRYLLGGGDVGFRSGGGRCGVALVWRRRAERRLTDHDVLRVLCGSMDWSRALVGKPAVALVGATGLPDTLVTGWCVRRRGRFL